MSLYLDTKVQFLDDETISTIGVWHKNYPMFAVANYSQERGGSVTLFDDGGEPLRDITYPVHSASQVTGLAWHPDRELVMTGWENGETHVWYQGRRDFQSINGPHKSPILIVEFSEQGGRMVTADAMGVLTGWRCDPNGQFLTMFNHDLKDPLLHVTFRKTVQNAATTELNNLARMAVAGDESALDTLTSWRPRTAARNLSHAGVKDNHCFYVGTQSGILYYINQTGTCTEVLRNDSAPIVQVLWHPKRETIITLMEDMTVGHFLVESTGNLTELDRVKLSARATGQSGAMSWAGSALAIITGDLSVRIWDIDTSDSYVLPMELPTSSDTQKASSLMSARRAAELFTCLAFCTDNQTLCSGTNQGNLFIWRKTNYVVPSNGTQSANPEDMWQLTNICTVRGAIKPDGVRWGVTDTMKPCILINCISNVFILKEQPLMAFHTRNIWAVQKAANHIFVERQPTSPASDHTELDKNQTTLVNCGISITNFCLNDNNLIVTNNRDIHVYKIDNDSSTDTAASDGITSVTDADGADQSLSIRQLHKFIADNIAMHLYEQSIVVMTQDTVKILSMSGVQLQEINFTDNEGKPIYTDLTGCYLSCSTWNGYIKLYNISRYEPKQLINPKCGYDLFENFGEIIMIKCNAQGTHLLLTIATESLMPNGKLYLWDFEKDIVHAYDFMEQIGLPINFYWDDEDARLLCCQVRCAPHLAALNATKTNDVDQQQQHHHQQKAKNSTTFSESLAYIMFVTNKCELKELESVNLSLGEQLENLCAPHIITLQVNNIGHTVLRDFKGLEKGDDSTRKMVLNFSLNLAQGMLDQAFSCIRSLKSEAVWTNLARMCVQTGRLDVAKVCLGHLQQARSVRALRRAMEDESLEHEAKVAILAIELNMIDEAIELYQKCERYDLLNRLYQASGRFEEALKIAEANDRVHLKNTYFKYAEWLRDMGDTKEALKYYELASSSTHNITEMLMENASDLKMYMQNTKDPDLLKWWAQYIESTGDMEAAFKVYQTAEDWFSQVRILCFLGQLNRAESIARQSGDRTACYHLARHYENIGKSQTAIQFYKIAQTYSNAVRICKENDLQNELWDVANSAGVRDKASAAAYFEEVGAWKQAVELYHRAGMLHKAVEMAFASKQPETLQVIAAELDTSSDPELVERCAEFFLGIEQPHKAVNLLANTRQFEKALAIAEQKGVPITETLAELLTPAKDDLANDVRVKILRQLGEILQEQGDYHAATKKFTQAGDKIRAMKSLLKSGDTDKVIYFASMSRQKEVYVMAGNYLQALNWQSDAKIMKSIVTFYSKGQAHDLLANFYANCAQVEIEEYHDYDKALKAMQEAARCLAKLPAAQRNLENLQLIIGEMKAVLDLFQAAEQKEYQGVIVTAKQMLNAPERPPIRHADILAVLVESLIATNQFSDAMVWLKELAKRAPDWTTQELINKRSIERLAYETGVDFNTLWSRPRIVESIDNQSDNEDDEIQEEVEM